MNFLNYNFKIYLRIFILLNLHVAVIGQEIPHPVNNTGIYEYLDEMANNRIIEINSAIKPYSRIVISQKLKEINEKRESLNSRQQRELDFYLRDFRKELQIGGFKDKRFDLFYYSDSLFKITVNPIFGGELFTNLSGKATFWRNGIDVVSGVGKWGFYASIRDNHENPLLGRPEYLTPREGGHIKGSADWSEMRGGVTYSWNWGNAGLIKENMQWGNNYHGANILSGRNPSFIHIKLTINPVKWFSLNYFHGFLNSMVVDSTRSYYVTNSYGTDYREVYHKKFMAANMFTFTPMKGLNISAGNSIVYSDIGFSPSYLVPFFFYKSVDHSINSGIDNMNSQMFFDISSRQIKHFHLYAALFFDELSVARFSKKDEWNFLSWKAGLRLSSFPTGNLSFTAEFTYTYPLTFQHYVPVLTFESNRFNLGHYLRDNSREWYFCIDLKPIRTMNINLYFVDAIRGPDYTAMGTSRVGNPPLVTVIWHNISFGTKVSYQVINDLYLWSNINIGNITGYDKWSPDYLYGEKTTFNFGISAGF